MCFSEVELHASINITIVGTVTTHSVSNELECFAHTVLGHFLLRLAQFLKFSSKDAEDLVDQFVSLGEDCTVF